MGENLYVEIEGNIGAGKSSIISCLQAKGYPVVNEPLQIFSQYLNHNPLVNVYVTPQSDAAIVQDFIIKESFNYYEFLQDYFTRDTPPYMFTDRSFESVKLFIELYFKLGYLSNYARDFLYRRYNTFRSPTKKRIKIYLNADPRLCKQRIKKRDRSFENNIPLKLLETLDLILKKQAHEDSIKMPVYTLNVSAQDSALELAERILYIIES